jgi:hypothetical protein
LAKGGKVEANSNGPIRGKKYKQKKRPKRGEK